MRKRISLILIACFIIGSSLMFRSIFKAGFSVVTSKTNAMIDILFDDEQANRKNWKSGAFEPQYIIPILKILAK